MHDEHSTPQSTEHAEKLGYEVADVSLSILMKWGIFLAAFVGVTSVIVLVIYAYLVPQYATRNAVTHLEIARPLPSADIPNVQPDPVRDIQKYRRDEAMRTGQDGVEGHGYGTWKDGDGKDVTYIPIKRAMEIVEAKGLPIASADSAKNDVTPPAVDRGFVDNPLPDQGGNVPVSGKTGPENGDNRDESSYQRHTPGM